jgi:hypothetical protein
MGTETVKGYGPPCHTCDLGIEMRYSVSDPSPRVMDIGHIRTPWRVLQPTWTTTHCDEATRSDSHEGLSGPHYLLAMQSEVSPGA